MKPNDFPARPQAKTADSENPEELHALANEEGRELSDEELDKVSGGWGDSDSGGVTCHKCGSANVTIESVGGGSVTGEEYTCLNCGEIWTNM